MREILFRGRRIDTGEWVYGHPVGWQNESGDISIVDSRFGACIDADGNLMMIEAPFVVKVDPATVGQYTGLKDKNGVKIFEGDIVTFEDAVADYEGYHDDVFLNRGEVTYTERGMCLYFTNRQVVVMDDLFYKGTADCEVVGNIYDNPEMAGEEDTL